jgi:hypothetical protein
MEFAVLAFFPSIVGCVVPSHMHVSITCVNNPLLSVTVLYTVCVTALDDYLCTYFMVLRVFSCCVVS